VSTGDVVTTSSLGFHLTLFVRTYGEEAELNFDFEAEDMRAAGDKIQEVSRRIVNVRAFSIGKSSPSFKLEPQALNN
jgi:hypothetical protein